MLTSNNTLEARTVKYSMWDRFEKHADKTFAYAADRYLKEFQGKDKTRPEQSIKCLLPYIGDMRLIDIDDEALQQFKHDRHNGTGHFDRPAMIATTNKDLTQCVTILNRACRVWRLIPSAPKLIHLKGDVRKAYPISWAEQDKLFRCLPTGWDVGVAAFAVNTGCRKEEIFGLKWADKVDLPELGDDVFVFVLNRTKNSHSRAVVCNSIARRAVEAQLKWQEKNVKSEYVFPSRANGRAGNRVRSAGKVWNDAWKKSGLPVEKLTKRGLHNMRHTFGYRLRQAGVAAEDREALLGHANNNLAQHYAIPDLVRLLAEAEKVTERTDTVVIRSAHDTNSYRR